MLDLAAAGAVEDAVAKVDARRGAGLDDQDLVGTHAEAPVAQVAQLRRCQVQWRARGVEHDKVVARAVHLGEGQPHRHIIGGAMRLGGNLNLAAGLQCGLQCGCITMPSIR
jgi:hypothetical protein